MADEIVFMNSGKLVEISKTETFLKSSNKLVKKISKWKLVLKFNLLGFQLFEVLIL